MSYLDKITDLVLFMVSEIEIMGLFVFYKPPQKHTNTNIEVYTIGPLSCGILLAFTNFNSETVGDLLNG